MLGEESRLGDFLNLTDWQGGAGGTVEITDAQARPLTIPNL